MKPYERKKTKKKECFRENPSVSIERKTTGVCEKAEAKKDHKAGFNRDSKKVEIKIKKIKKPKEGLLNKQRFLFSVQFTA